MIPAPEFSTYPRVHAPVYSRWVASGVALLVLCGGAGLVLRSIIEPRVIATCVVCVVLFWWLALLLRVLYVRLNWHNARTYHGAAEYVRQTWWRRHRQNVALVESVLISAACTTVEQGLRLFSPDHQPPEPQETAEGPTLHLCQVFGREVAERECNLATLLALKWQDRRDEHAAVQPLRCYWQGSLVAWQAFVEQMALCAPEVQLPAQPEPWEGLCSLDSIIDQLQGAPATARILCAGCQSSPIRPESNAPAGEAALLWILGAEGSVRFSRGEWFVPDIEQLPAVARRALQQSNLTDPVQQCIAFAQADLPDIGLSTHHFLQDANFGALQHLQAMVVQTLAAWYVEQHQVPCAWLATDPYHALALGVVHRYDSDN